MNQHSLLLADPPRLSDETAAEMLDFMCELINAFENHYSDQLQRHYRANQPTHPDLFEDFNDDLPDF